MTCLVGLAAAGSASANDVVLWACHGPAGQPLGSEPFGGAPGAGCATAGTTLETGGATHDNFSLIVGPDLLLEQVFMLRATSGLGNEAVAGKGYTATYRDQAPFDASSTDVSGPVTAAIAPSGTSDGGNLRFLTTGTGTSVTVQRIGLTVADTKPPTGALNAMSNNVSGTIQIPALANDAGAGLDRAEAWVDGALAAPPTYFDANCKDLTPGAGAIDLPIKNTCPAHGDKTVEVKTTDFTDGPHQFTLKVYDIAGNETDFFTDYVADVSNHPNLGSNSATLNIGSGNSAQPNGSGSGGAGGSVGVAGATATSCNSPRLSMELSQKPVKISKGAPVLKYAKRYRFRGRLTCVVGGKRRSAPVKTPIELLNVIGKKTYRKGGATVRKNGAITIILAYKSSRTLVFRYTNPDGRRSQVKLKIQVTKKPKR